MKRKLSTKIISVVLAFVTCLTTPASAVYAAENSKGKYISDVYIAYGSSEEEAKKWLTDNGWEPVGSDLNKGNTSKASGYKDVASVMGIKRTNDPNKAVTDMAVMNMMGGYSFDDYKTILEEKKTDINEFIRTFIPVLEEYRANFNGEGSEGGQKRAQYAHDLLNKLYDGGNGDEYAVNDTGLPLGDLFLNKTKAEYTDEEYAALSEDEKKKTADLQQIILESTGTAVMFVEQALALATDKAKSSWLDRAKNLTGTALIKNIGTVIPSLKGKKLTASQAIQQLNAHFEDYAKILQQNYNGLREDIIWFEQYSDDNGLWQKADETEEEYSKRAEAYFNNLNEISETRYDEEFARYTTVAGYYSVLKDVDYAGAWGDKLYDFFRDEAQTDCGAKLNNFLPLAASLSSGQRAAMEFLSLPTLIKLGSKSDDVMEAEFPSVSSVFKDSETGEELESISVYSGMNRAIFREGVALTSEALMRKNGGYDPYEQLWGEGGVVDIVFYSTLAASVATIVTGAVMHIRALRAYNAAMKAYEAASDANAAINSLIAPVQANLNYYIKQIAEFNKKISDLQRRIREYGVRDNSWLHYDIAEYQKKLDWANADKAYAENYISNLEKGKKDLVYPERMSTLGRWVMGVGGLLLLASAALKFYQMSQFYNRTFTRIPLYIVHEDDIVKYDVDGEGNVVKTIDIDQYVYYEVVKCNRQAVGINKKAQTGVSDYASWGCGDAADLKCDIGKQWLALYVNKSREKGDPILADSIVVQYENSTMPEDCTGCLHAFTYTNAMDIGSDAYSYRNDKKGIYLFWKSDADAFMKTASTFNKGYLALAAFGGLAVGIVGTTVALYPKRKKNKANATA
jgi:hypothetical protein